MTIGRFKKEYIKQAKQIRLLGATLKETAEFFEITAARLATWRNKHPDFNDALRDGAMDADAKVAEGLYKRACGYSHQDNKIFQFQGEEVIVPYTKHIPPDVEAAKFWLRVRQSEKWGEKAEKGKDTTVSPLVIKRHRKSA